MNYIIVYTILCTAAVMATAILSFFAIILIADMIARAIRKRVLEWKRTVPFNPKRDKVIVKRNGNFGYDTYIVKNAIPYPRPVLYK